ncbi:hypothetical protein ACFL5K_05860 [Gemmatimonadota bacterium]
MTKRKEKKTQPKKEVDRELSELITKHLLSQPLSNKNPRGLDKYKKENKDQ